jgi:hypothetical protein
MCLHAWLLNYFPYNYVLNILQNLSTNSVFSRSIAYPASVLMSAFQQAVTLF